MPDKVARAKFVDKLVSDNLDWIGLKPSNGSVKVLDYGAGTGFFSQVGFFAVNRNGMHTYLSDIAIGIRSPCHPNPRNRQLARHGS